MNIYVNGKWSTFSVLSVLSDEDRIRYFVRTKHFALIKDLYGLVPSTMAVAQLVEWSLLTQNIFSSNPTYLVVCFVHT